MNHSAPWQVECGKTYTVYSGSTDIVFRIEKGTIPTREDARLIAAAPDLLAIAVALCDLANPQELEERGHHDMAELCRMARAAIAKAEGKQ